MAVDAYILLPGTTNTLPRQLLHSGPARGHLTEGLLWQLTNLFLKKVQPTLCLCHLLHLWILTWNLHHLHQRQLMFLRKYFPNTGRSPTMGQLRYHLRYPIRCRLKSGPARGLLLEGLLWLWMPSISFPGKTHTLPASSAPSISTPTRHQPRPDCVSCGPRGF